MQGVNKLYEGLKDVFKDKGLRYKEAASLLEYFLFGLSSIADLVMNSEIAPSLSSLSRATHKFNPEEDGLSKVKFNRFMRRVRSKP